MIISKSTACSRLFRAQYRMNKYVRTATFSIAETNLDRKIIQFNHQQ